MQAMTVTLSFRAAWHWGAPHLAGQPVSLVSETGQAPWEVRHRYEGLLFSGCMRPSECQVPGGIPPHRARFWMARRRRALEPIPIAWGQAPETVILAGTRSGEIARTTRRHVRGPRRSGRDGSTLVLMLAPSAVSGNFVVSVPNVSVGGRRGARPLQVRRTTVEVEVSVMRDDQIVSEWITVGAFAERTLGGTLNYKARMRITVEVGPIRGFRPRVMLSMRLRLRPMFLTTCTASR